MKTSHILAAAALSILATAGAQAESYQGVQPSVSAKSRDEVNAEAISAAAAADQNIPRGSRGAERFTAVADPAVVRAQAIATANAADANVTPGSKYNSRLVSTMNKSAESRVQAQTNGASAAK